MLRLNALTVFEDSKMLWIKVGCPNSQELLSSCAVQTPEKDARSYGTYPENKSHPTHLFMIYFPLLLSGTKWWLLKCPNLKLVNHIEAKIYFVVLYGQWNMPQINFGSVHWSIFVPWMFLRNGLNASICIFFCKSSTVQFNEWYHSISQCI